MWLHKRDKCMCRFAQDLLDQPVHPQQHSKAVNEHKGTSLMQTAAILKPSFTSFQLKTETKWIKVYVILIWVQIAVWVCHIPCPFSSPLYTELLNRRGQHIANPALQIVCRIQRAWDQRQGRKDHDLFATTCHYIRSFRGTPLPLVSSFIFYIF